MEIGGIAETAEKIESIGTAETAETIDVGDVVRSLFGHDKEVLYIVLRKEGSFVYLTEGKIRSVDRPKKKNRKHVRKIGEVEEALLEKLRQSGAGNEAIKYFLKVFGGKHVEIGCD